MKMQPILYILFALLIGLLGGYLLFGGEAPSAAHDHPVTDAGTTAYTCSMHPQIQRDAPGDCPICGMDLIPLETATTGDPTLLTMTEAAVAMAQIRTTVVGTTGSERATSGPLNLTGRLATDERTAAVEAVDFGGRLERLLVTFPGEQIRAGQRIATIYSPELVVAQEELLAALRLETLSPELLTAARNKLRNLEISDEQIAEVEASGEVITNFPVFADRSGTVREVRARVGDYVSAGAPLYTLTNLNQLWALFDAYERDLASIDVGDPVTFGVASLPGQTFRARVSFIDPVIDPSTRTASVRAEVTNARGSLKPEMFITGKLETSTPRTANDARAELTVPRTAVLWTGERSVVYVEVADAEVPTYEFREVELGEPASEGYRVISGISSGERVVTNGAFSVDAAAQLRNQLSMMNRDVVVRGAVGAASPAAGDPVPDYRKDTPEAFRRQLTAVASAYLPLKDRMVSSEMAGAEVIDRVRVALGSVDMSLVTDAAHSYWMEQLNAMNEHLVQLANAGDIDGQRQQFGFFSRALINALTAFGSGESLFVQHCPMAYDNEGGDWLSEESAIRNPYFGEDMLTCGYTTDTLQAR